MWSPWHRPWPIRVAYEFPKAHLWNSTLGAGRACALPLLRPGVPRKPHPSASRLLSSAFPRPHRCPSHIWEGSLAPPGRQWGSSVALVGVSADSAPLALKAGNPKPAPPLSRVRWGHRAVVQPYSFYGKSLLIRASQLLPAPHIHSYHSWAS